MRTIFHLDLDAFFVSVERIFDPSLIGKPVIVGGDPHGRGVVAACSYEARKFGLHSAMPIRTAFRLCPNGIYLHGHHEEYVIYSKSIKNFLAEYAPVLEQASVDEFYADFTGCERMYGSYLSLASFLQKEIMRKFSLPVSIGIAPNKTLAKIGSDYNKPEGITYIPHNAAKEFLRPLPIERIPGVGKVTANDLHAKGIFIVGDIADLPEDYFSAEFGKPGIDLWKKANGEGTEYLTTERWQKSISKETTFTYDVSNKEFIENTLFKLAAFVCQKLRDDNISASCIGIKLRYSDFKTFIRSKTIEPSNDDMRIFDIARELYNKAYTRRVAIRLIGIHLTNFTTASEQLLFFEDMQAKRKRLLSTITSIRKKYGFSVIKLGAV